MSEGKKSYRLEAPKNVRGTNWILRFYGEIVPVRNRIAEPKQERNYKDLLRRGWKPVGGKKEEKKADPPKAEEPKTEEPKSEEPKAEAPKPEAEKPSEDKKAKKGKKDKKKG